MLNHTGRRMVSATIQEGTTLYPPGEDRLKNIVSNYTSLTGSDKWLLGSIMLLVFRPLLVDVEAMVSAMGSIQLWRLITFILDAQMGGQPVFPHTNINLCSDMWMSGIFVPAFFNRVRCPLCSQPSFVPAALHEGASHQRRASETSRWPGVRECERRSRA